MMMTQKQRSIGLVLGIILAGAGMSMPSGWTPRAKADDIPEVAQATPQGYAVLHVDAIAGNDQSGDGRQLTPLRTITRALAIAQPNTVILLSGGTYSAETGEVFPLQMKPGVTVQGPGSVGGNGAVISGHGIYGSPTEGLQYVTLLGADNAGLASVTVSNPHPSGVGLWVETGSPIVLENTFLRNGAIGIYLTGAGTPVIRNNYFSENGEAGLVIAGTSTAEVRGNVFENTGVGISIAPTAAPHILENQITRNQDGLIVHANARPVLQGNQVVRNRRNSIVEYGTWTNLAILASQPTPPAIAAISRSSAPVNSTPVAANQIPPPTETLPASPPPEASPPPPSSDRPPATTLTSPSASAQPPAVNPLGSSSDTPSTSLQEVARVAAVAVPPSPMTPLVSQVDLSAQQAATSTAIATLAEQAATIPPPADESARSFAALPEVGAQEMPANGITPPPQPIPLTIIPPPATAQPLPPEASSTLGALPGSSSPGASANQPVQNSSSGNRDRLPVPDLSIPIGSGGSALPTVITGDALVGGGPPPPPSRALTLGLPYKVFVETSDAAEQAQVRQVVSDAFRVNLNGRQVMQVGAYPNEAEAQAQVQRLQQLGFSVRLEVVR